MRGGIKEKKLKKKDTKYGKKITKRKRQILGGGDRKSRPKGHKEAQT